MIFFLCLTNFTQYDKDLLWSTGTLLTVMWQPGWAGGWGRMDACICMAELLRCSPETITALFIGSIPIQKKKLKKN